MVATVGLVIAFRSSTNLAGAYGMAVVTTMTATDVLAYAVARERWRWAAWHAGLVVGVFLLIDLVFFGANLIKITRGGWLPLLVAIAVYTVMSTWHTGRRMVAARLDRDAQPLDAFLRSLDAHPPVRVPGTGVFLTSHAERTPPVLVYHLARNKALHEHVVLLTITTLDEPVAREDDVDVRRLREGIYRVVARRGFMQRPDAPGALKAAHRRGLPTAAGDTTFYLSRMVFVADSRIGMAAWRDRLFAFLSHNVRRMPGAFQIPAEHTVEIPIQLAT
jgi:KUP system potassium uptake protein